MQSSELLAALRAAAIREITVRGVAMHIRGMTAAERIAFLAAARESRESGTVGEEFTDHGLFCRHVVAPDGTPLFSDPAEVKAAIDATILTEVVEKVLEASGLGTGAKESVEKNS